MYRTGPAGAFEWLNGEPFIYQNWGPGEPNNYLGIYEAAGQMDMFGTWNDLGDWDTLVAVIQRVPVSQQTVTPEPATIALLAHRLCRPGWTGRGQAFAS